MSKTIVNGSFADPAGNFVANGVLILKLSQDARETTGGQVAPLKVLVPLDATGDVDDNEGADPVTILANDELSPSGTWYRASVNDANGARVWGPQKWSLQGGSPIDLDGITPAPEGIAPADPTATPQTRRIDTTGPLTGGGDLTADRVFAISPAVAAKGDWHIGLSANTWSRLTVGVNGEIPIADSSATAGIRWGTKRNLQATTDPLVTDDSDSDYEEGSFWVNISEDNAYVCVDDTVGAAVWMDILSGAKSGGSGGGGGKGPARKAISGGRIWHLNLSNGVNATNIGFQPASAGGSNHAPEANDVVAYQRLVSLGGGGSAYWTQSLSIFRAWDSTDLYAQTECRITTALNDTIFWFGFTDRSGPQMNVADPASADLAAFRWASGSESNFKAVTKDGSTISVTDTGIVADNVYHRFEIIFDDAEGDIEFKIDGVSVATKTGNLPPTANMLLCLAVTHGAGGNRNVHWTRIYASTNSNLVVPI